MELQFQKNTLDCLRPIHSGVKSQEQTQEVRLPEALPDIGKVLAVWGQVVLRSKEWHGPSMGAAGGVMTWVLYAPEDGTFPRVIEAWVPWQMQWELPQTQRDGTMIICPQLKSVDARAVSARKLVVRSCVDVAGDAYEPVRLENCIPASVPEKICLLKKTYPACVPVEAGEKTLTLEETLSVPGKCSGGKLLHYSLQPRIQEKKLLGDKLLFRGTAVLQGLCQAEEESLSAFSLEIPFSTYTEVETECSQEAQAYVTVAVTNLELDLEGGNTLQLKASLVGQYLIADRKMLEIVEDAYSPGGEVQMEYTTLELPVVLEWKNITESIQVSQELDAHQILEISAMTAQPQQFWREDQVELETSGTFQTLYEDENGQIQGKTMKWEQKNPLTAAQAATLSCNAELVGAADAAMVPGSVDLHGSLELQCRWGTVQQIPMVTALQWSENTCQGHRPGLILRRPCGDSLWAMAKACGSTEEAIRQANGLGDGDLPERMLLIPVI